MLVRLQCLAEYLRAGHFQRRASLPFFDFADAPTEQGRLGRVPVLCQWLLVREGIASD